MWQAKREANKNSQLSVTRFFLLQKKAGDCYYSLKHSFNGEFQNVFLSAPATLVHCHYYHYRRLSVIIIYLFIPCFFICFMPCFHAPIQPVIHPSVQPHHHHQKKVKSSLLKSFSSAILHFYRAVSKMAFITKKGANKWRRVFRGLVDVVAIANFNKKRSYEFHWEKFKLYRGTVTVLLLNCFAFVTSGTQE